MRPVTALCLVALVPAGCGSVAQDSSKDFSGQKRVVAATIERLETAARDSKPDVVCTRLLSSTLLAALRAQGTNCRTGVREAFRDADSIDLEVDDVTIRGARATARVKHRSRSDSKTSTLQLAREDGTWKISSLGG